MVDHLTTPDAILADLWARLEEGMRRNDHPFRLAVVGTTVLRDGRAEPELRTVVLRSVDPIKRQLIFFTDIRSAKIAQIESVPAVQWLFYDPTISLQLRIRTTIDLHTACSSDPVAIAAWDKTPTSNRVNYASPLPPGTPVPDPATGLPKPDTDGARNFVVVAATVREIDWLHIGRRGHWRALIFWQQDQSQFTWVTP